VEIIGPERGQRLKLEPRRSATGAFKPVTAPAGNGVQVSLDEYLPNSQAERVVTEGGPTPNPAVKFSLQSEMAKQSVSEWLLANIPDQSQVAFGPMRVAFVVAHDAAELQRLTAAPATKTGTPPQVRVTLEGKVTTLDVAGSLNQPVAVGEAGVKATLMGYWPDFRMDDKHQPSSASDEPHNPAALVILTRGENEERCFVFADPQIPAIRRATHGQPVNATVVLLVDRAAHHDGFNIVLGPDVKSYYAAQSQKGFKAGALAVGQTVEPGWMDFKVTVEQLVTNAVLSERIVAAPVDPRGNQPAVRITARQGTERASAWVQYGTAIMLPVGNGRLHVMFGPDTMKLPFSVVLEKFEVERDEGTANVAGWTSHVLFSAPDGATEKAAIWMNHPGWFRGYKFSQASWNPNDLQYTALQVKKDPVFVTWLTWAGSGLICVGIAWQFWGRQVLRRKVEA
jgi:hypothetical protein